MANGKSKTPVCYYLAVCSVRQSTDEGRQDSQRNRPCSADTCCHLRERREEVSPTQYVGEEATSPSNRTPQHQHPVAGSEKDTPGTHTHICFCKTHLILFMLFCGLLFPLKSFSGIFSQVNNCFYCNFFNDQSLFN